MIGLETVQRISANESYSNINTPCSLNAQQPIAFQQMARRQQNQYTMCDHSNKLEWNEKGNEHVEM